MERHRELKEENEKLYNPERLTLDKRQTGQRGRVLQCKLSYGKIKNARIDRSVIMRTSVRKE